MVVKEDEKQVTSTQQADPRLRKLQEKLKEWKEKHPDHPFVVLKCTGSNIWTEKFTHDPKEVVSTVRNLLEDPTYKWYGVHIYVEDPDTGDIIFETYSNEKAYKERIERENRAELESRMVELSLHKKKQENTRIVVNTPRGIEYWKPEVVEKAIKKGTLSEEDIIGEVSEQTLLKKPEEVKKEAQEIIHQRELSKLDLNKDQVLDSQDVEIALKKGDTKTANRILKELDAGITAEEYLKMKQQRSSSVSDKAVSKQEVPVYLTVDITKPMFPEFQPQQRDVIAEWRVELEQKGAKTENPLERAIIGVELAALGFTSGLVNFGKGIYYTGTKILSFDKETYIDIGKGLVEWAKSIPERIQRGFTESPFWVGEVAGEIVAGEILGIGVGRGKIWYHDVVPEEGSPLSFEPLPKSEIAKARGAKIEITKAGKGELTVFGEIKEVKPYTAKEVGGIIKTKSITGSKETVFVSRGSETVSITKESPSVIGKVLGREEKISVEKTKIVDTKPKVKENVRYFRDEEGFLIEKPQFEREGISRGGLTKELIEQKETITRVPKEFTEVGKAVDFSVPFFVPTVRPTSSTPREREQPTSKEITKPKPKPDIIEGTKPKTDIIPKIEPKSMEDVLNDVFTTTSLGTGTLTRTATRTTIKQTTKQRTRQRSKTIVDVGIPRTKPPKPKVPIIRGKPSFLRLRRRKRGKITEGFRLNIYATSREIVGGLRVFKGSKKVSKRGKKKGKRKRR